jgi:hypothetical protein
MSELAADEEMARAPMPVAQQQHIERLIIKNANLSLEVESVPDAEAAINAQVSELQGYIVHAETRGTDERRSATLTMRVPADRFDSALERIEATAHKVLSRSVSGDDVTEEFVDLEARLRNLEATQTRLLALLDQATQVEDALRVSESLTQVQGQIEQVRGRMQYLEQSAALSTITVSLQEPYAPSVVRGNGWNPLAVAREAFGGLLWLAQSVVNLAIVLLVWTPIWLPLLLLARWGWRKRRSRPTTSGPVAPGSA